MPGIDAALCDRYVIFLDIDGVLLPVPKFTFGGGELNAACVQRLNRLVTFLGGPDKVTIILSSTWRNHPEMVDRLDAFMQAATEGNIPHVAGGTPNGTVLVTPVSYYAEDPSEQRLVRDRVDEVYRWLHEHVEDHPEAIGGRWFAIDDMKLDVDERMVGHFLHTATDVGLTEEDLDKAKTMVGASLPSCEAAVAAAEHALIDPALKEEEIRIHEVLEQRLQGRVDDLTTQLDETREQLAAVSAAKKEQDRLLKEKDRQLDDVRYRLAVYDFSKRSPALAAAVELAAKTTGAERKPIDELIKKLVLLMMEKKELEKQRRAEMKKASKQQQ